MKGKVDRYADEEEENNLDIRGTEGVFTHIFSLKQLVVEIEGE